MDVHGVVQEIKDAAAAGQDVVDSAASALDKFLDSLDQAFSSGDPNAAKQLAAAVRQHKQEIAEKIAE